MNSLARTMRALLIIGCVSLSPALRAQDGGDLGERFGSVTVPEGFTKEELCERIAGAGVPRGWEVREQTDRHVIVYLKHRGNEAIVTLLFDAEKVEIYCVGWAIDRTGKRIRPEQPAGWLGNLQKDITRALSSPR